MIKRKDFAANHLVILLASITVSYLLIKGGAPQLMLNASHGTLVLSVFVAGLFFTSLFTLPFSYAALGALSLLVSPVLLATVGAAGAMIADLFLLSVVEEGTDGDIEKALSKKMSSKVKSLLSHPFLHWLTPIVGALIIASPLPDELGLTLMGLVKIRPAVVAPISYVMNFIGILGIVWVVKFF